MAPITVHIKCANSKKYAVKVDEAGSVTDLKNAIQGESEIPAAEQRLIYKGKVLKDEQNLPFYELVDEAQVHLVRSMTNQGGAPPPAPAPTSATSMPGGAYPPFQPTTTPGATAQGTAAPANPFLMPPMGGAPMPGMMMNPFAAFDQQQGAPQGQQQQPFQAGSNPLLGGGIPGFPPMMGGQPNPEEIQRMQSQLMQNPEMMRSIMNSPMMQSMMSNPDLMRNMIMNNPQMRQVLDANPQLNHVLNDPQLMRQAMEYMQNPAAMREAMRSQDLAMSQIENHPEGFNALRRMYEDIQEPLMQATADAMSGNLGSTGSSSTSSSTSTSSTSTRPNTAALPNPWAASSSTSAPSTSPTATPSSTGTAAPGFPGMMSFPGMFGAPQQPGATPGSQQPGQPGTAPAFNPYAGMGMPGMAGMGGAPPDMETTLQMMQNPMMQSMMQAMLSNPQFVDQMAATNPMMRQMLDANPQMREMMSNPQVIQQLTDPNTMRMMMSLQRSGMLPGMGNPALGFPGFGQPPQQGAPGTTAGVGGPPPVDFSSLFSSLGQQPPNNSTAQAIPGAFPVATPIPNTDPATRYATQLQQLEDMGFSDRERNLQALQATMGNVNAAIERLLAP